MLVKAAITLCGLALGASSAVAISTNADVDANVDGSESRVVVDSQTDADAGSAVWLNIARATSSAIADVVLGVDGQAGAFENPKKAGDAGAHEGAAGISDRSTGGVSDGAADGNGDGTTGRKGDGTSSGSKGAEGAAEGAGQGTAETGDDEATCSDLAIVAGLTAAVDADADESVDASADQEGVEAAAEADAEISAAAALWLWLRLGC